MVRPGDEPVHPAGQPPRTVVPQRGRQQRGQLTIEAGIRPGRRTERADMDGPWLDVGLPSGTRITLTSTLALRAYRPSYRGPDDDGEGDG